MPNGGSDHCGNCRHNRVNIGRVATTSERFNRGYCTVRDVELRAPASTYCANHYVPFTAPIGPMFSEFEEHQRIPYFSGIRAKHADVSRCEVCGNASAPNEGVEVPDPAAPRYFCGPVHYARWWKQAHPGQSLKWDCDTPEPTPEERMRRDMVAAIDLARAFIRFGDIQGAREVLGRAAAWTDPKLREEALALLASLGD